MDSGKELAAKMAESAAFYQVLDEWLDKQDIEIGVASTGMTWMVCALLRGTEVDRQMFLDHMGMCWDSFFKAAEDNKYYKRVLSDE